MSVCFYKFGPGRSMVPVKVASLEGAKLVASAATDTSRLEVVGYDTQRKAVISSTYNYVRGVWEDSDWALV